MSNKKHIDRLFQEKFKDFERTPDDAVWSNIEAKLNKKKKRRVIPIWWRYAGVAAILLILLTVGNSFFNPSKNNPENPSNQVVNSENKDTHSSNKIEVLTKEIETNLENKNNNDTPNNKESVIAVTKLDKNEIEKFSNKTEEKTNTLQTPRKTSIANTNVKKQKTNTILSNKSKNLVEDSSKKDSQVANTNLEETKSKDSKTIENTSNNLIDSKNLNKAITNSNTSSIAKENTKDSEEKITKNLEQKDLKENKETIEEAIAKNENIIEEEENLNRWSISPNAAPVYFNTLGEGSSIASQFNTNNKTGEVNMSYGVNASYAINKKLIVRSGINRVNLGYNTNNVAVFESINSVAFNSLNSIKGSNNDSALLSSADVSSNSNIKTKVSLISTENLSSKSSAAPQVFSEVSNATINQELGFIEIPLEFQYIISDKKLGLNVIGGFSSFFLNNNEIFSETSNSRTLIGEAVNVNKVSYSANFGLGLNYKVTKKINLNFEPMFKYQINTFENTSGDFKPFFIGVYTGFGIKF